MAKSVKPAQLGAAISQELEIYNKSVVDAVDKLSAQAAKDLVEQTKATAPVGARGDYRRSIASKQTEKTLRGSTYAWYVRSPNHRLTHLLVHGHATKDGGRTKSNPFLENAANEILPAYEKKVEEVLRNGR